MRTSPHAKAGRDKNMNTARPALVVNWTAQQLADFVGAITPGDQWKEHRKAIMYLGLPGKQIMDRLSGTDYNNDVASLHAFLYADCGIKICKYSTSVLISKLWKDTLPSAGTPDINMQRPNMVAAKPINRTHVEPTARELAEAVLPSAGTPVIAPAAKLNTRTRVEPRAPQVAKNMRNKLIRAIINGEHQKWNAPNGIVVYE